VKPIKHILLKLSNQTIGRTYQAVGKSGLVVDYTYNPQDWVPSYGEVVETCNDEIKIGDVAYVDYFSVLMALGVRYNTEQKAGNDCKFIEDAEGLKVFIHYNNVFFVMRGEELIGVNGNVIIEPIYENPSAVFLVEKRPTEMCYVLSGPHKGKKMVFRKQRMRNCGQYGFNTKDFYVVHGDYLMAEVEE
jgi:hypothetical protein